MRNAVQSASRAAAVIKYFAALCASMKSSIDESEEHHVKQTAPASRRQQLSILYLFNDVLHHIKYHTNSTSIEALRSSSLQAHLTDIFGFASAYNPIIYPKHHQRLIKLLGLWEQSDYYPPSYTKKLREMAENAANHGYTTADEGTRSVNDSTQSSKAEDKKDAPFVMPSFHGEHSIPFYDLPAGNILPLIEPNATRPVDPQSMKPLQFSSGPAQEYLIETVKDFLKNADSLGKIYNADNGVVMDVDELGQLVMQDETAGNKSMGEGYFGWSIPFCEKMKRRRGGSRGPSMEPRAKASGDRSVSPRKRRYSDSSRSRSRSSSRTSRGHIRRRIKQRRSSRSSSASRDWEGDRSRSRSASRSPSYSPPPINPSAQINVQTQDPRLLGRKQQQSQSLPAPSSTPALVFPQGIPLGPNGLPLPPPRPPDYFGPWPPPPPPIPGPNMGSPSQIVPPPPPPSGQRMYQDRGSHPFLPGPQGTMPSLNSTWDQPQLQHSPPTYTNNIEHHVNSQSFLNGHPQALRGRSFVRGGHIS